MPKIPGVNHLDAVRALEKAGFRILRQSYSEDRVGWYGPEDWGKMSVNAEVRGWCERALSALQRPP